MLDSQRGSETGTWKVQTEYRQIKQRTDGTKRMNLIGHGEAEALPERFGPPAEWHDKVGPGEAAAAAGSSGAVLQAGGFGR